MRIWLTTDTHFGHEKMVEFGRPKGFEEKILAGLELNTKVGDILIHLGDFCIGNDAKWLGDYLYRLPGRKHWLIRGNHDRKSNSWYIDHGWDWIGENMELKMFNKNNIFSHIPLAMFRIPWNSINIHGHLHGNNHRESEVPLTELHKLLALENTNYQPVLLEKFINAKTI